VIACPSCAAENPDRAKFCNECGTALAAPPPIAEERKTVTTLFCDLVSFTAMSEAADPEDVDRILSEYFARATRAIESHGGTVEKFIGDAVVGVFGVPAVHEDDPERAVRAGLRLLESLEGMSRPDGTPLQARIGVNTGEALVRLDVDPASGRGFLTGDAVNTAARLEAAAPPGGVCVGALTHSLTERAIVYKELPPISAKGKAEPVDAWLAKAPVSRLGVEVDRDSLTPFVGREPEFSHLRTLLEKAVSTSSPQFALIMGEPGIGKSRLVQELFAYVDSRPEMIRWRQGHCLSYGDGITYWALAEIVKSQAGILETDDVATVSSKLDAVVPEGGDRIWLVNRLRALVGLEAPEAEREENFMGWLRFLDSLAVDAPLVVVLEDMHWADDGLLSFVEHLVEYARAVPLLLIGTARPELFERHPTFAAGGAEVSRISLGPLGPDDTQRLVTGLLGDTESLGGGIADIVERSQGNPFFAEESARLLTGEMRGASVPASVQAVVAARLDALPAGEKTLLSDAAVVGDIFWGGAIAALDHGDGDAVESTLCELEDKRLVRRRRESSMAGEKEFSFVHVLAREVTYGSLPRRVRAEKHARVAAWFIEKAGGRPEEVSELLTHHQLTAFELAQTVGDTALCKRLREPTVAALRLAGKRTMRLDVEAAERMLARALELSPDDDPLRAHLLQEWAQALLSLNRNSDAKAALEEAVRRFLDQGFTGEAAVATTWLEKAQFWADGQGGTAVLGRALELIAGQQDNEAAALVFAAMAGEAIFQGQYESGLEWAKRAVAVHVHRGEKVPLELQGWQAQAECGLGDRRAGDTLVEVTRAMRDEGMGREAMVAYVNAAEFRYPFEGPRAYEFSGEGLEFTRSHGISTGQGNLALNRWAGLFRSGRWDEAGADLEALRDWLVERDDRFALAVWWQNRAALLAATGMGPDALDAARKAEDCAVWDVPILTDGVRTCLILALASVGRGEETLELLGEVVGSQRSDGYQGDEQEMPGLMRCALQFGEPALAEQLLRAIRPGMPLLDHVLTTGHALLAEWRCEQERAAAGFADAAARWHEFGVPYEEGHALFGQGRCLVALGRAPEAARPLEQAREIFARLGAKPALEETEEWLEKATGH